MTFRKSDKYRRIYRFAMYGRAASGKTCILAALAMKRIAHPRRYTSTWIIDPPHLKKPAGDPDKWDIRNPATGFYHGREWLEKSISMLTRGELPPPNPNRAEPLRYLYDFTTPDHQTFQIELIDYSGELIDPAITDDKMAQKLREHISSTDGILVLAEAPYSDQDNQPLATELLKLEQAFVMLKGKKGLGATLDIPVALLIDKWDRRGPIGPSSYEVEKARLDKFLNTQPEPPHRSLVDTLRNSVSSENFKVFPCSAFGRHEIIKLDGRTTLERPAQINPLMSFGLEDGFIWMARRRNVIELENFETRVNRRASFCFWKNRNPFPPLHLVKAGKDVIEQFPKGTHERKRAKLATRKISIASFSQTLCSFTFLIVLLLFGETLYDGFRYRTIVATDKNPQATAGELRQAEKWLESYYRAPGYLHIASRLFVLDRGETLESLQTFRNRREEMLWQPVKTARDQLVRVELARRYLSQFGENGKYKDTAESIITKAETTLKYQENEIYLANIASSLDALLLQGNPPEQELKELQAGLEHLPQPSALNQELFQQQRWLQQQISIELIKQAREVGKARWVEFREKYFQFMRERKIAQAAQHLNSLSAASGEGIEGEKLDVLISDFKKRVLNVVNAVINDKFRQKQWTDARNYVKSVNNEPAIISQLNAVQVKKLQQLLTEIDREEDEYLYEMVQKYRDDNSVDYYLQHAPLKRMERYVANYRKHLEMINEPLHLTLMLNNIFWGDSCGDTDIFVALNGKPVVEKRGVSADRNHRSSQIGYADIITRLSDNVQLHAEVTCNGWFGKSKIGEVTWEGAVKNLNGLRIGLESVVPDRTYLTFTLNGQPKEPPLPPWGE